MAQEDAFSYLVDERVEESLQENASLFLSAFPMFVPSLSW